MALEMLCRKCKGEDAKEKGKGRGLDLVSAWPSITFGKPAITCNSLRNYYRLAWCSFGNFPTIVVEFMRLLLRNENPARINENPVSWSS